MLSQLATRSISFTPKLRLRLIKFRHGVRNDHQSGQVNTTATSSQPIQASSQEAVWDFQIPQRWRRKPLDEQEIAIINNGGPL